MNLYALSILCTALLFALMPLFAWRGYCRGRRILSSCTEPKELSTGTVDAAILSLLALLTAFTFSSAYSRYEMRRQLVVDEVNAIGTAYLRLDLLPVESQSALREQFKAYTRSRYQLWDLLRDRDAALAEYARQEQMQNAIWKAALAATEDDRGDARKLLLPALNEMIDITNTRLVAVQSHPPVAIFLLLGGLSLAAAWVIGYGMAKSTRMSYVHVFGFAAMGSLALFLILDIEFPRYGFVTLNEAHEMFLSLEKSMH